MPKEATMHLVLRLRGGGGAFKATIIIKSINGNKIKSDYERTDSIFDNVKDYPSRVDVTYTLGLGFEDIVTCFTASGVMSDKLLQYLSVEDLKTLREKQTSDKIKE